MTGHRYIVAVGGDPFRKNRLALNAWPKEVRFLKSLRRLKGTRGAEILDAAIAVAERHGVPPQGDPGRVADGLAD